jgi:hypothetical protein
VKDLVASQFSDFHRKFSEVTIFVDVIEARKKVNFIAAVCLVSKPKIMKFKDINSCCILATYLLIAADAKKCWKNKTFNFWSGQTVFNLEL